MQSWKQKKTNKKLDPKIIHYRDYGKYYNDYNDSFRQDLVSTFVMENINLRSDLSWNM